MILDDIKPTKEQEEDLDFMSLISTTCRIVTANTKLSTKDALIAAISGIYNIKNAKHSDLIEMAKNITQDTQSALEYIKFVANFSGDTFEEKINNLGKTDEKEVDQKIFQMAVEKMMKDLLKGKDDKND